MSEELMFLSFNNNIFSLTRNKLGRKGKTEDGGQKQPLIRSGKQQDLHGEKREEKLTPKWSVLCCFNLQKGGKLRENEVTKRRNNQKRRRARQKCPSYWLCYVAVHVLILIPTAYLVYTSGVFLADSKIRNPSFNWGIFVMCLGVILFQWIGVLGLWRNMQDVLYVHLMVQCFLIFTFSCLVAATTFAFAGISEGGCALTSMQLLHQRGHAYFSLIKAEKREGFKRMENAATSVTLRIQKEVECCGYEGPSDYNRGIRPENHLYPASCCSNRKNLVLGAVVPEKNCTMNPTACKDILDQAELEIWEILSMSLLAALLLIFTFLMTYFLLTTMEHVDITRIVTQPLILSQSSISRYHGRSSQNLAERQETDLTTGSMEENITSISHFAQRQRRASFP